MKIDRVFILAIILASSANIGAMEITKKAKAEFDFFAKLPKDLQGLIIAQVINVPTFEESMKALVQLRRVNKTFKDLIDNEHTGKAIITMAAEKHKETEPEDIISTVVSMNLASSWAWLKEQVAQSPEMSNLLAKKIYEMLLEPDSDERMLNQSEIELIEKLINAGANLNHYVELDIKVLDSAIIEGELEVVRLILKAGIKDINYIDVENRTPLDFAIEGNNPQIIELLKEHGAKTAAELQE